MSKTVDSIMLDNLQRIQAREVKRAQGRYHWGVFIDSGLDYQHIYTFTSYIVIKYYIDNINAASVESYIKKLTGREVLPAFDYYIFYNGSDNKLREGAAGDDHSINTINNIKKMFNEPARGAFRAVNELKHDNDNELIIKLQGIDNEARAWLRYDIIKGAAYDYKYISLLALGAVDREAYTGTLKYKAAQYEMIAVSRREPQQ